MLESGPSKELNASGSSSTVQRLNDFVFGKNPRGPKSGDALDLKGCNSEVCYHEFFFLASCFCSL